MKLTAREVNYLQDRNCFNILVRSTEKPTGWESKSAFDFLKDKDLTQYIMEIEVKYNETLPF